MQARFDKQIASLATQAKNEKTTPAAPTSNPTSSGNHHSKQDPYTVAAWRLIKKEDTVTITAENTIGALAIITAEVKNTTECTLTINQVNMINGAKIWMIVMQLVILETNLPPRHQLLSQKHLLKSSFSTTSFAMHFALKPDSQLRQLIVSGQTLRERIRSKSRVE